MFSFFRWAAPALLAVTSIAPLLAEHASERLREAAAVVREIMQAPDQGIPQDLLDDAECVIVIPGVKKAAFVVGGSYGRGFAMCRRNNPVGWTAPAAVRMEGGSFGFQAGASESDIVMLVMNRRGMEGLLESKFTIGGSAEAAAGPVGRSVQAKTDAKMRAQILSWSRSRGVFAGISLAGATLRNDLDENRELYGRRLTNKQILTRSMPMPHSARPLIAALNENTARARSK